MYTADCVFVRVYINMSVSHCCFTFRFKDSMIALVGNLKTKDPFYVRCIKPNEMKSPVQFNDERSLHQV